MMKKLIVAGITAGALIFAAPTADAQVNLGVAGGPTIPAGDLSDVVDPGFHGGVVADIGVPLLPFGVRGDLMFQHLPGAGDLDSFQQLSGTVNGRFSLLPVPLVSLYLTGGIGLYGSQYDGDRTDTVGDDSWSADFGLNGGVGARLNLLVLRPFIEARYHSVMADETRAFIPVTIGVYF